MLCEKPLAITEEQLCAVLAAEQKSAAFLGVCQQNRYEPNMRKLKEMTEDDPPVGGYANVVWKRDAAYYASLGFRSITSFGCYLGPDYQRLYGNPPLKEYGSILRCTHVTWPCMEEMFTIRPSVFFSIISATA